MSTPRQTFKAKLANLEPVTGIGANQSSAALVEFLAQQGFDQIFIDCEHAGPGIETVIEMARAARAGGAATILRPWSREPGLVRHFLDTGIDGLIAPDIETGDQVREMLDVIAAAGAGDWENTHFVALVESRRGIDNLDDILSVEGLDAIQIGPVDLALSMGLPRRPVHDDVKKVSLDAFRRARAAGVSSGGPVWMLGLADMVEAGANIFMYMSNNLLAEAARHVQGDLRRSLDR
jgi:4-hydroxy-2-oxoheptanedioate aldolase